MEVILSAGPGKKSRFDLSGEAVARAKRRQPCGPDACGRSIGTESRQAGLLAYGY
jgi:hypothetical protein